MLCWCVAIGCFWYVLSTWSSWVSLLVFIFEDLGLHLRCGLCARESSDSRREGSVGSTVVQPRGDHHAHGTYGWCSWCGAACLFQIGCCLWLVVEEACRRKQGGQDCSRPFKIGFFKILSPSWQPSVYGKPAEGNEMVAFNHAQLCRLRLSVAFVCDDACPWDALCWCVWLCAGNVGWLVFLCSFVVLFTGPGAQDF